jgi:hypothetical protein
VDTVITIINLSAFLVLEDCRMFWRLDNVCDHMTTCHTVEQTVGTALCQVAGVALLDGRLPLALALVLILSSMFMFEVRTEAYPMTFGGFLF